MAGAAAFVTRIRAVILRDTGAAISPFNAWILLQGLETLSLRVERHVENTLKVVDFLSHHPKVAKVNHPSLVSHPDHELYTKLYPKGAGSIFTFEIKGGEKEAWAFIYPSTIRLSIGIEHIDDLLEALEDAFKAI